VKCNKEDGTCDEMANEIKFMGRVRKEDSLRCVWRRYGLLVAGEAQI